MIEETGDGKIFACKAAAYFEQAAVGKSVDAVYIFSHKPLVRSK